MKVAAITESEDKSDDALFKAFTRGDTDAFDHLYTRYRQPLFGYLMKNCSDEALASELFQDVWLRIVTSAAKYNAQGKFRAWLFTLAHNRLVDYYRKNSKHEFEQLDDIPATDRSIEDELTKAQQLSDLQRLVGNLPLEQRSTFLLREEAGLSLKEIAEIQQINLETAKSRLRYAYKKLSKAISEISSR